MQKSVLSLSLLMTSIFTAACGETSFKAITPSGESSKVRSSDAETSGTPDGFLPHGQPASQEQPLLPRQQEPREGALPAEAPSRDAVTEPSETIVESMPQAPALPAPSEPIVSIPDDSAPVASAPAAPAAPSVDSETAALVRGCAEELGIAVGNIDVHVASNNQSVPIATHKALFVKIDANRPNLTLDIKAQDSAQNIAGICIYMAGNSTTANISLKNSTLEQLYYQGFGNQMSVLVKATDSAILSTKVHIEGNQTHFKMEGAGQKSCGALETKVIGNNTTVSCN